MADKTRKTPAKMQLFLVRYSRDTGGTEIIGTSNPGDISDKTARAMVEAAGDGEYTVITGRARKATLSRREVVDFSLV